MGSSLLPSNAQGQAALDAYKKRWGIEVLFANLKSRGFDLEETHLVHEERIEKLIALLVLAMSWAHIVGEWLALTKPIKGRKAKSLFRYGLDHLQYVLLKKAQEFLKCIGLLLHPPFFTAH